MKNGWIILTSKLWMKTPQITKRKRKPWKCQQINKLKNKNGRNGDAQIGPHFLPCQEFWIGTFLSFYFKLGPKHMNLSLCPNLVGLKRTLKFLEMAALFHIHCHHWALPPPLVLFYFAFALLWQQHRLEAKAWIFC